MFRLKLFVIVFILSQFKVYANTWPKNIENTIKSTCIIEFYQPQNDNAEIKDRSRIKKNLIGLLVSQSGLILTTEEMYPANLDISSSSFYFRQSQHLPEDITVKFENDQKYKATFLGKDEGTKLAFIKINEPDNLPSPIIFNE